jgi:spermidine dehydrogenase
LGSRPTKGKRALGVNESITRRDYFNSTLVASGSVLLGAAGPLDLLGQEEWDGYSGVGDYHSSNGNTFAVMSAGHKIRDRAFEPLPVGIVETGEQFDCIVVGGGISGLAAGLFFQRATNGKRTCLILENHPVFGGEARRNEFEIQGQRLIAHQASAMYFPQLPNTFLASFYESIGIRDSDFHYQTWEGSQPEIEVGLTPYFDGGPASAYFFGPRFGVPAGFWLRDPWGKRLEGAPIPEQAKKELLAMKDAGPEKDPKPKNHGDAITRHLDSITLEQHLMEAFNLSRDTVRSYLSPSAGGGSGLGADALSAYAEYAADVLLPWDYAKKAQMFPGGNAGVARHLVKAMLPDVFSGASTMTDIARSRIDFAALDQKNRPTRIRLEATVIAVAHTTDPQHADSVTVIYFHEGKLYRVKARSAIVAGGSWTAKHIVKDLPPSHKSAYEQFHRAPCLMANVALRNWQFLYKMGISEFQWFEGIGNYTAVRRTATLGGVSQTISPDSPVVLTVKILFSSPGLTLVQQVTKGRAELYTTPFRVYETKIRDQLAMMFSHSGFDARRDIVGLILNRWGHAYLSPQPGFFFGTNGNPGPGDYLRNNPYGRIAFANSDLAGIMDHRMSILEAQRAVAQISERI